MSNLNLTGIPDLEREIYELRKRIACLEEQLRWRPVWEQPEKSGYYEVEFDNGNFHDMIFYNEHSSWRCSQEHVNITGWRPIPELEGTDE